MGIEILFPEIKYRDQGILKFKIWGRESMEREDVIRVTQPIQLLMGVVILSAMGFHGCMALFQDSSSVPQIMPEDPEFERWQQEQIAPPPH